MDNYIVVDDNETKSSTVRQKKEQTDVQRLAKKFMSVNINSPV